MLAGVLHFDSAAGVAAAASLLAREVDAHDDDRASVWIPCGRDVMARPYPALVRRETEEGLQMLAIMTL